MSTRPEQLRIVVAGASGRSAAQRADLAGFDVLAIDLFSDRDLRSIAQVQPIDSIAQLPDTFWSAWVGAPVLLCGGMENRLDLVDCFHRYGLVCNLCADQLAELRNPDAWSRWASESGLLWPETHGTLSNGAAFSPSERWLRKSRTSAGGLGVWTWRGERLESSEYLQRQLDGEVLGVTFLSQPQNTLVVGCMKSWLADSVWGPSPFLYRGSVGPIPLQADEWQRLLAFAHRIQEATGLLGVWQADFVRNRDGWWILEINPRWSSSMELLEVAYDVSLVDHHARAVLAPPLCRAFREDWNPLGPNGQSETGTIIGKAVRYASSDLTPTQSMLDRWWEHRWDGSSISLRDGNRLADIPGETTTIAAGYPICTEYAVGASVDQVHDRLQETILQQTRLR
jgi:uncharacterized protein